MIAAIYARCVRWCFMSRGGISAYALLNGKGGFSDGSTRRLAMKLKELRKERGWTQPVLAKRARLSAGYIARVETGRHDPKLSTLVKLAKALGVPVTELLG